VWPCETVFSNHCEGKPEQHPTSDWNNRKGRVRWQLKGTFISIGYRDPLPPPFLNGLFDSSIVPCYCTINLLSPNYLFPPSHIYWIKHIFIFKTMMPSILFSVKGEVIKARSVLWSAKSFATSPMKGLEDIIVQKHDQSYMALKFLTSCWQLHLHYALPVCKLRDYRSQRKRPRKHLNVKSILHFTLPVTFDFETYATKLSEPANSNNKLPFVTMADVFTMSDMATAML